MAGQERILLVEQSRENREKLRQILSAEYQIAEAESGREALELLRGGAGEISLILLDSTVSDEQGTPLLECLRQDKQLAAIPVVAVTERDAPEQQAQALAQGAEDYVSRPYNEQVVLHRVSSVIRLRESACMMDRFRYDRLTGLCTREYFFRRVRGVLDEQPHRRYEI